MYKIEEKRNSKQHIMDNFDCLEWMEFENMSIIFMFGHERCHKALQLFCSTLKKFHLFVSQQLLYLLQFG